MAHNFGHILLYRPFLHYLAKTKSESPPDQRLLRCAFLCVKVSRFTISRSDEMLRAGCLAPAAWQSVYTVFLSLVTLVFFLATQMGNKEYAAIQRETETGIRILVSTSCQDIGSRKCLDVLRVRKICCKKWFHTLTDFTSRYSREDSRTSSISTLMPYQREYKLCAKNLLRRHEMAI